MPPRRPVRWWAPSIERHRVAVRPSRSSQANNGNAGWVERSSRVFLFVLFLWSPRRGDGSDAAHHVLDEVGLAPALVGVATRGVERAAAREFVEPRDRVISHREV